MKMKKWILATAMATSIMGLTATEAMAEMKTYYCVPYLKGNQNEGVPAAATVISQVDEAESLPMACDLGTDNAWASYLQANIKDYALGSPGVLGPYESFNEANAEYLEQKGKALQNEEPFHHASDFSFQPDN